MNRVKQMIKNVNELGDSINFTEEGYKGKRKGTIYYERMEYLKKKKSAVENNLLNFGRGEFKTWEVLMGMTSGVLPKIYTFNLPSDITSDEILAYLEEYIGKDVISIKHKKTTKLGFIG